MQVEHNCGYFASFWRRFHMTTLKLLGDFLKLKIVFLKIKMQLNFAIVNRLNDFTRKSQSVQLLQSTLSYFSAPSNLPFNFNALAIILAICRDNLNCKL